MNYARPKAMEYKLSRRYQFRQTFARFAALRANADAVVSPADQL
jgi:hypothetical protein